MAKLYSSQRLTPINHWSKPEFVPDPRFRNGHMMTVAPLLLRRSFGNFADTSYQRLFTLGTHARLLGHCHFQNEPKDHFTLILLHGLEGSSQSPYVLGTAQKAFNAGLNVIRLNMRNCGGSMHLSETLYNAGLSSDILSVAKELVERDGLHKIMIAGYSLGGNLVLKAAAEDGQRRLNSICAVAAISPSINLERAIEEIERPNNRVYENWFLRTLKQKLVHKARMFPNLYDPSALKRINSIRSFDDHYTAPDGGYGNADNYYKQASAVHLLEHINVPAMIVASEDDPLVPFDSFDSIHLKNEHINFLASKNGGHGAFIQARSESAHFDKYWAENRVVAFCLDVLKKESS